MKLGFIAFASLLLVAGCDTVDSNDQEIQYVVESYQVAGETFKQVRLTRTTPVNTQYDFEALAVRGAEVSVQLLRENGEVEESYPFSDRAQEPGVYAPEGSGVVQPLRKYRLSVTVPETGDRISAETLVPDTFRVVQANADTVVYQGETQLELKMSRSTYPTRQTVFIFSSEALDPREDALVPFAKYFFDEGDATLEELRLSTAPLLNEANYTINPDGTLTALMPWLMVNFYGPQRVSAAAVDDNLFDFVRSYQVQQGGSTLSPGEIPNIIDHVEGGTGVFASMARVNQDVFIARP